MLFYHQMSDSEQQRKKQKITAIKDEKKKKNPDAQLQRQMEVPLENRTGVRQPSQWE